MHNIRSRGNTTILHLQKTFTEKILNATLKHSTNILWTTKGERRTSRSAPATTRAGVPYGKEQRKAEPQPQRPRPAFLRDTKGGGAADPAGSVTDSCGRFPWCAQRDPRSTGDTDALLCRLIETTTGSAPLLLRQENDRGVVGAETKGSRDPIGD